MRRVHDARPVSASQFDRCYEPWNERDQSNHTKVEERVSAGLSCEGYVGFTDVLSQTARTHAVRWICRRADERLSTTLPLTARQMGGQFIFPAAIFTCRSGKCRQCHSAVSRDRQDTVPGKLYRCFVRLPAPTDGSLLATKRLLQNRQHLDEPGDARLNGRPKFPALPLSLKDVEGSADTPHTGADMSGSHRADSTNA